LAAAKKASYVESYGRPGAEAGWHFLTGEQDAIDRLAEAVGFRFRYDEKTNQFAHASGIMVLTPEGKLARYFYGITYPANSLRLGLVEASEGKVGSPVDQLLLFCFHYDAESGTYKAAMTAVRLAAALTVLALAACLVWAWRREARKARKLLAPAE
jgi:protein SCO1/2